MAESLGLIEMVSDQLVGDAVRALVELVDAAGAELVMGLDPGAGAHVCGRRRGCCNGPTASLVLFATATGTRLVSSDFGHHCLVRGGWARRRERDKFLAACHSGRRARG